MKQWYRDVNFAPHNRKLIETMNGVVDDYAAQGFRLTVRQVFYQLVARGHIENTMQSYKRVASIINDGRMAGLIDWDAIEDRTRSVKKRSAWGSASDIVQSAADSFHMDMWDNQNYRVFVIVEKQALEGIMQSVCNQWDVPLVAARGYPSVSVVKEMVEQYLGPCIEEGKEPVILHFGDHDPSGIDMTRDLIDRIQIFAEAYGAVDLQRLALNMNQIHAYKPPPNPAKTTDSRFAGYMREHGTESWELDALEPRVLVDLVERTTQSYIDDGAWAERTEEIEGLRAKLQDAAARFRDEQDD